MQSLTIASKYNFLLQDTKSAILRAADRWEDLWHGVIQGSGSETRQRQGFAKHTEEMCWLVRKLVNAGHQEAPECRYTQIVPTDNIKDLHEFLCR